MLDAALTSRDGWSISGVAGCLERRRAESCIPPERSADSRTREVNRPGRIRVGARRFARPAVERLRAAVAVVVREQEGSSADSAAENIARG